MEIILVVEISDGLGGEGIEELGMMVDLFVVDIFIGWGFVMGKLGLGKLNMVLVIIENLLLVNFLVFIVDIDGEYYGFKQEFELFYVGVDDECDIQVSFEYVE